MGKFHCQLIEFLFPTNAEYKKVRADIKKRTAEAQRWQKKAKKIRSGMAGGGSHATGMMAQQMNPTGANDRQLNAANQELLRAADAAQIDLNSRLALLQVTRTHSINSPQSAHVFYPFCFKLAHENEKIIAPFVRVKESPRFQHRKRIPTCVNEIRGTRKDFVI